MYLTVVTWQPDTCGCSIALQYDDDLPDPQKVMTPVGVVPCARHKPAAPAAAGWVAADPATVELHGFPLVTLEQTVPEAVERLPLTDASGTVTGYKRTGRLIAHPRIAAQRNGDHVRVFADDVNVGVFVQAQGPTAAAVHGRAAEEHHRKNDVHEALRKVLAQRAPDRVVNGEVSGDAWSWSFDDAGLLTVKLLGLPAATKAAAVQAIAAKHGAALVKVS